MSVYVCFYTHPSFWAEKIPNFIKEVKHHGDFTRIMSEKIFRYGCHSKYELIICRDGMIMFSFDEIESKINKSKSTLNEITLWSKYADYLNAIYLLLESAILNKMGLAPFEISELTRKDIIRTHNSGESIPESSITSLYQMGRWLTFYYPYIGIGNNKIDLKMLIGDPRIARRVEVKKNVFDDLNENLEKIIGNYNSTQILSRLVKSLSQYKKGNYSDSLVISWFIIETLLNKYWELFLNNSNKVINKHSGEKRINNDRLKKLIGSDYSASVISNILELVGVLDYEDFKSIDNIRRKRNDIVHEYLQHECTDRDCKESFQILTKFIKQDLDIDLKLNESFSWTGL